MIAQAWYSVTVRIACDTEGCQTTELLTGETLHTAIDRARGRGWHIEGPIYYCPTCTPDPSRDMNLEISLKDGKVRYRRLQGGPVMSQMPPDKPKTQPEEEGEV
jgi:hypothetical protein